MVSGILTITLPNKKWNTVFLNELKTLFELPYSLYVFGATFIVFPVLAIFLARYFGANRIARVIKITLPLFLVYLIAFHFGYSFPGDYVDYSILGLSYPWLCLLLFSTEIYKSRVLKIIRVAGYILITVIGVFCAFLFPFFIYGLQDLESDRKFHFTDKEKKYEVRRYSYGGAISSNTRYAFETYRLYSFLPIEQLIDVTDFFDDKTNLGISDSMTFSISDSGNRSLLQFSDKEGQHYVKQLK